MPPKFVGRRGGARVAVGATHPAKLATAAKKANAAGNNKNDSVVPRTSPSRGAKTIANARIHDLASSPHDRVSVASMASTASKRAKLDNTTPDDNPQAELTA